MKRTCNGCKALGGIRENKCDLGYKTESVYHKQMIIINVKPLEECPKPKTNNDYIHFFNLVK